MKRKTTCCTHTESNRYTKDDFWPVLSSLLSKDLLTNNSELEDPFCCLACFKVANVAAFGRDLCCGHVLVVDTGRLELYCQECRDYVYLQPFDEAVVLISHQLTRQQPQGSNAKPCYIPENDPASGIQAKRQKLQQAADADCPHSNSSNITATPAADSLDTAGDGVADVAAAAAAVRSCIAAGSCSELKAADGFPLGLRGLNNLGNTCFMNSVLQVMLHAPLLSSFFLGEGHDPTTCRLTARDKPCLSCQMEGVFAEVYSGNRVPFSPAEFLYQWWRYADSLAGYQQQDAHEFYLSLLEGMSGAVIAMPNLQQQQQQTPVPKEPTPGSQQQQQVDKLGYSAGVSAGNDMQHQQQGPAAGLNSMSGLDVLGRSLQPGGYKSNPSSQLALQQQQQQQIGGLPGGQDLHTAVAQNGDWPQWHMQLLQQQQQQQGLNGWYQGYGYRLQQQYGGYTSGMDTGQLATPEPVSEGATPEPEGAQEGGSSPDSTAASLVELVFSGLLRSDVRCCACGHTSTAHDPFRDISLDLHVPRPPKLPPAQPHSRTPAAAAALAAKATAGGLTQQAPGAVHPAAAADVSPAAMARPAGAGQAAGGEYSGVTAGGVLGREITPPLLLVTPSPTPPPSDLMLGDYGDNDDAAAGAAADTAAGGLIGSSRLQSPAVGLSPAGTQSNGDSLSAQPVSGAAADAGAEGTGVSVDVSPDVVADAEQSVGANAAIDDTPPAAVRPRGLAAAAAAAAAGKDVTHALDAASTGTSMTQGDGVSDLAVSNTAGADALSGDKSPEPSDLCGPAASQSSQQIAGMLGQDERSCSQLTREHTPEPGSYTDGCATGAADVSQTTPQQQLLQQGVGAGACRESTPQSQQQTVHTVLQQQQQAGSGVASNVVRHVSGSLGQLVRGPVAAIKQLLPGWSGGGATAGQQQQQEHLMQGSGQLATAEGDGDNMGALLPQQQQQQPEQWFQQQHTSRGFDTTDAQIQQYWQQQQQQQEVLPLSPVGSMPVSGNAAAACVGGGSSRAAAAAAVAAALRSPRQQRCGKCKYCVNRHLKKGCEVNRKHREDAKQTAMMFPRYPGLEPAAAAAGCTGQVDPAAAAAMPAAPPAARESAATQPTHPLAGLPPNMQQQHEHHHHHQQQQQGWPGASQPLNSQHYASQQYPHMTPSQQWQHPQHHAAVAPHQAKARSSPKPSGPTPAELLANAAVQQGLMKKRDERGRFYRKEDLQAWAQQLYEEGKLAVDGFPVVSAEAAAAATARGLPEPPAVLAAKAAAAAAANGVQWGAGKPASASAGAAAKAPGSKAAVKKGSAGSGSTAAAAATGTVKKQPPPPPQLRMNELSLSGCLRRFVRPERLGHADHWRCSACGSSAAALKQMSIRRLPLVLCFHVKRFEHGGGTQRPKKLDVPMRFPLRGLDMAPFTSSEVLKGRAGSSKTAAAGEGSAAAVMGSAATTCSPSANKQSKLAAAAPDSAVGADKNVSFQQQCLYELFGVVSHAGDMASGHYVSYVKCDGCWYLINDPWVVAVAEADVAQVQAYMLFYAQEHLFGTGGSSGLVSRVATATAAAGIKEEMAAAAGQVATKLETIAGAGGFVKLEPGVGGAKEGSTAADEHGLLEEQGSNKAAVQLLTQTS